MRTTLASGTGTVKASTNSDAMSQTCTHCEGTGFLNLDQAPPDFAAMLDDPEEGTGMLLVWLHREHSKTDVAICDCCGIPGNLHVSGGWSDLWHGERGEHYNDEDPPGMAGPYGYNGGLCECH